MPDIVFTIKENRIKKSSLDGFRTDGKSLFLDEDTLKGSFFLPVLDSGTDDMEWGRFHAKVDSDERRGYYIYAFASDHRSLASGDRSLDIEKYLLSPDISHTRKIDLMERINAKRFSQKDDVLLYGLRGRYLYLGFYTIGEGKISVSDMKLDSEGDVYLKLFPELYRDRGNFFHRFISIFASCYHDMRDEIDDLPKILDPDLADASHLAVYAGWLGIEVEEDSFSEDILRGIVKEAWQLNRMKGSKWALHRLLKIILDEDVIILEQNLINHYNRKNGTVTKNSARGETYDVTILVRKEISKDLRVNIVNLLDQFVPVRSRINIKTLTNRGILDANSYMDINATVFKGEGAEADKGQLDNGMILLS